MGAGLFLIIVILVVVAIIAVPAVISATGGRLTRDQKAELRNLREFKKTVERLALENQDVYPDFSYQIRDEIRNYEYKELN